MGKINASSMGCMGVAYLSKKENKRGNVLFLFVPSQRGKDDSKLFLDFFSSLGHHYRKECSGRGCFSAHFTVSGIFTFLADCLVLKEKKGTRFFCVRNKGQIDGLTNHRFFFRLGGCFVDPLTYFLSSSFLVLSLISSVKLSRSVQRTDIGRFIGSGIRIY